MQGNELMDWSSMREACGGNKCVSRGTLYVRTGVAHAQGFPCAGSRIYTNVKCVSRGMLYICEGRAACGNDPGFAQSSVWSCSSMHCWVIAGSGVVPSAQSTEGVPAHNNTIKVGRAALRQTRLIIQANTMKTYICMMHHHHASPTSRAAPSAGEGSTFMASRDR